MLLSNLLIFNFSIKAEKSIKNKEFFRMDITAILNQDKDLEIIFHSFRSPYIKSNN